MDDLVLCLGWRGTLTTHTLRYDLLGASFTIAGLPVGVRGSIFVFMSLSCQNARSRNDLPCEEKLVRYTACEHHWRSKANSRAEGIKGQKYCKSWGGEPVELREAASNVVTQHVGGESDFNMLQKEHAVQGCSSNVASNIGEWHHS